MSLDAKLQTACEKVEAVEKRGRNDAQNYDYVLAEDIAIAGQKALREAGLLATFECIGTIDTPISSRSGNTGLIVKATCVLRVGDPESGEVRVFEAIGYGADYPGDKGIYKAMTGARKYALIHLLGIPIGDEPEEGQAQRDDTKITEDIARAIVEKVAGTEAIDEATFRLAIGHVTKRDVGELTDPEVAVEALQSLTFDEATQLDSWVNRKIATATDTAKAAKG